jgi:glycine/D-amino acid oxidase-like deaminating enzyme
MEKSFSFWEQERFLARFDVLVIGGGLVGLMAAYQTKKQNSALRVGVIEAGFLPTGASTKNAGFACFGSISELIDEVAEGSSEAELLAVVELRWKGLQLLRSILGDEIIDYEPLGGFEMFKSDQADLAQKSLNQIGHFNSLLSDITGSNDIYRPASEKIKEWGLGNTDVVIENKLEGQIDTGKMMLALIRRVQEAGVLVFTNCRVEQIEGGASAQIIHTNQAKFSSRKIIVATNAFSGSLFPELNIIPGRGQVLVTEPIPNLKIRGAFHYDRGYYYFRNVGDRILLGGGRNLDFNKEQTTEFGVTDLVQNELEKLLTEVILPGQKPKIDYRWSGIMAFGDELKPIITEVIPGVYAAVRCNGMGVAMGSQMGKLVAELVVESV